MRDKIIELIKEYYPDTLNLAGPVADKILELFEKEEDWECGVNWAGLDPAKWGELEDN